VDVDEAELDGRLQADFNVVADLKIFLEVLLGSDVSHDPSRQTRRFSHCAQNYPMQNEQEVSSALSPHLVMETISSIERSSSAYLVDVGQHQMWAAQSLRLEVGQRFLTSGGLGAMGFSIPAGIGVAGGSRERVAVIIGDGGAQMVLAELETVRFLNLPVRIYVINNNQHGMVAQFQEENLSAPYVGTRDGYSAPNFSAIAQAFGIPSIRVTSTNELGALEEALARGFPTGPVLIEIVIDKRFKALPKLGKNNSLSAM
jgi:acetolactate synthase-1/2/3 large subunit